jgi:hypothetical protein
MIAPGYNPADAKITTSQSGYIAGVSAGYTSGLG